MNRMKPLGKRLLSTWRRARQDLFFWPFAFVIAASATLLLSMSVDVYWLFIGQTHRVGVGFY